MTTTMTKMNQVPDSKFHVANMGLTWVLSAPDGPHVGPMYLPIRGNLIAISGIAVPVPYHSCQVIATNWGDLLPITVTSYIYVSTNYDGKTAERTSWNFQGTFDMVNGIMWNILYMLRFAKSSQWSDMTHKCVKNVFAHINLHVTYSC